MSNLFTLSEVLDGVFLAAGRVVYYVEDLRAKGITRVLKLYTSHPASIQWPTDFDICDIPVTDGVPVPSAYLRQGIDFIRDSIAAQAPVVVVCSQGISRSPTFVLAYLLETGFDLPTAWRLVKEKFPTANPQPPMWQSLLLQYQLPYSMADVAQWTNHHTGAENHG